MLEHLALKVYNPQVANTNAFPLAMMAQIPYNRFNNHIASSWKFAVTITYNASGKLRTKKQHLIINANNQLTYSLNLRYNFISRDTIKQ